MMRNGDGRWRGAALAVLLATSAGVAGFHGGAAHAKTPFFSPAAADTLTVAQLPAQGRSMLALIYQGGPFSHEKDGVVFRNRERLLPANVRTYYREYTDRTPGERSRGARRIVCGGLQPSTPDDCIYTDDHYASFRKIVH